MQVMVHIVNLNGAITDNHTQNMKLGLIYRTRSKFSKAYERPSQPSVDQKMPVCTSYPSKKTEFTNNDRGHPLIA